jgi:hypothetical protein
MAGDTFSMVELAILGRQIQGKVIIFVKKMYNKTIHPV